MFQLQAQLDPHAQMILSGSHLFLPQDVCICCPLCLDGLTSRSSHGWLLLVQISAEMSPLQKDLLGHQLRQYSTPPPPLTPVIFCSVSLPFVLLCIRNYLEISCWFITFLFISLLAWLYSRNVSATRAGVAFAWLTAESPGHRTAMVDTNNVFTGCKNEWIALPPSLSFAFFCAGLILGLRSPTLQYGN